MEKKVFIKKIQDSRDELECLLSQFSPTMMERQNMVDDWSIKDIIAHISWYEGEMVKILSTRIFQGSPLWDLDLQERNIAIHDVIKEKDLNEIIQEEKETFSTMLNLLQNLDGDDLNNPTAFEGMPFDWIPWNVIASNTYEHYDDHIADLNRITSK